MAPGRGERGQWILAGLWGSWLGFLCVHKTGDGMILHLFVSFIGGGGLTILV